MTGEEKEPEKGVKLNPGEGAVVGINLFCSVREGDEH